MSNSASLHDLTIRLGEFQVAASMAVMAAHSSFFEAKIQAEGDGPFEVDLDERKITAAGLKVAMEFAYTAEANTNLACLTEVFAAAQYLQMADLRNATELQLVKLASVDQAALAALKLTATNPVSPNCRRLVIQGVAERFGQLPSDRLNETATEEFCALLANPKLDGKLSYTAAQRVVDWIVAKPNRIDVASRVLQLLHIPEMSDAQAKLTLKLLVDNKLDWVSAVDIFRDEVSSIAVPGGRNFAKLSRFCSWETS